MSEHTPETDAFLKEVESIAYNMNHNVEEQFVMPVRYVRFVKFRLLHLIESKVEVDRLQQEIADLKKENDSVRKIQDQLLSKIRVQEETIKYGYKEGSPNQHNKRRIETLEKELETLSVSHRELVKMAKSLFEIVEAHAGDHLYKEHMPIWRQSLTNAEKLLKNGK